MNDNMLSFLFSIFSFRVIFECSCIAKHELHIATTAPSCGTYEYYIVYLQGKVIEVVYPSMPEK